MRHGCQIHQAGLIEMKKLRAQKRPYKDFNTEKVIRISSITNFLIFKKSVVSPIQYDILIKDVKNIYTPSFPNPTKNAQ